MCGGGSGGAVVFSDYARLTLGIRRKTCHKSTPALRTSSCNARARLTLGSDSPQLTPTRLKTTTHNPLQRLGGSIPALSSLDLNSRTQQHFGSKRK